MKDETLPAQGSKDARDLFVAKYQNVFGPHPSAKALRRDDNIARLERQEWDELIDSIEPRLFRTVIDNTRAALREQGRRGKATLDDIRVQADELQRRFASALAPAPAGYVAPEDRPITRREYLLHHQQDHPNSPTFAALWRLEFGTAWPGYTPPADEKPAHRVPWLHEKTMAKALNPEPDYELQERAAIQETERHEKEEETPW